MKRTHSNSASLSGVSLKRNTYSTSWKIVLPIYDMTASYNYMNFNNITSILIITLLHYQIIHSTLMKHSQQIPFQQMQLEKSKIINSIFRDTTNPLLQLQLFHNTTKKSIHKYPKNLPRVSKWSNVRISLNILRTISTTIASVPRISEFRGQRNSEIYICTGLSFANGVDVARVDVNKRPGRAVVDR